jgi:hypothetical protein
MHVSHLKHLPLQPATPVEPVKTRKKRDEDQDRISGKEDEAREERRRRQAWLEASLEQLDEEGPASPGDETYQATSAPAAQSGEVPAPPKSEVPAPASPSPLDELLAGIKAEPSIEHAEVVIEPKPSLDELLSIIREQPEET